MNYRLLGVLLLAGMLNVSPAWAAKTWKVSLKDADISALVSEVAEITGKNFIVDPRVKGNITVISSTPLTADQVYDMFMGVLNVNGFAAVPSGKVIKIVPDMNAKTAGVKVDLTGGARGEDLVTRVVALESTNVQDLVPVLRPMMPQFAHLAAVPSVNSLILSDRADNVAALAEIIRKLDSGEGEEVEVVLLNESRVGDVVSLLESLTPVSTGAKDSKSFSRLRVVADERTNRLIIKGDAKARKRVRELVSTLDAPSKRMGGVQVFRLRHASAKQVAEVLKGMSSSGSTATVSASSTAGGKESASSSAGKDSGGVSIIADEVQNALVVRADASVMRELKDVIDQLDVRRAQVLIQAAIVEVSGSKGQQLGVQWAAGNPSSGVGTISFDTAGTDVNTVIGSIISGSAASLSNGANLVIGSQTKDANGDTTRVYGALIQALATASNANLLSTPSILTLDNQEAKIVVGQNVPFITGQSTSTSSTTSNPFTTIERKDVGITLKVVPHISEGNVVRLEVEQEVSAVVPSSEGIKAADLITNTRTIKTTILAEDAQTIVLGGLIQDDTTKAQSKVPLLGDIPLLGKLFRATKDTAVKRNLLVFLQPTIMRDSGKVAEISRRHYDAVRTLQLGVWKGNVTRLPEDISGVYGGEAAAPAEKQ